MARGAAVALATLAALLASACGSTPDPSESRGALDVRALAAGSADSATPTSTVTSVGVCLAGARQQDNPEALSTLMDRYGVAAFQTMGEDPIWTDGVDCGEPHEIEVYGVVTLPGATERKVASYASLVNPDTQVYGDVEIQVRHACALSFAPAAAAMRATRLAVDVQPAWAVDVDASLTWAPAPPTAWDGGDHTFLCLFEQARPGTLRLAEVVSRSFPVSGRICLMRTSFISCRRRHDSERIATITVDRAVTADQLGGVAAVAATGDVDLGAGEWRQLDRVCQRYLDAAAPHHSARLRGVANTYPELYPDADGRFVVLCSAQAPFGSAPSEAVVTSVSVFGR